VSGAENNAFRASASRKQFHSETASAIGDGISPSEWLKAIVVSLPHNLAVAKLEKHGKVRPHLLPSGECTDSYRQDTDPQHFENDSFANGIRGAHMEALAAEDSSAALSGGAQPIEIATRAGGHEPIWKFLLHDIRRVESIRTIGRGTRGVGTGFNRSEKPTRGFEVGRLAVWIPRRDQNAKRRRREGGGGLRHFIRGRFRVHLIEL